MIRHSFPLKAFEILMPKIVSKPYNTHVLEIIPMRQKQRKTLGEYRYGTSQRPFEDQVRELFHNSRVPKLGELCLPCFLRALSFYSSVEPTSVSCVRRFFLTRKIIINRHISCWDSCHVGILLTRVNHETQVISI